MGAKASVSSNSSENLPFYTADHVHHVHARNGESASHDEGGTLPLSGAGSSSPFSLRAPVVHHRSHSSSAADGLDFRQLRHPRTSNRGRYFSLGLSPRTDSRTHSSASRSRGGSALFGDSDSSPEDDFAVLAQLIQLPVHLVSLNGELFTIFLKMIQSEMVLSVSIFTKLLDGSFRNLVYHQKMFYIMG